MAIHQARGASLPQPGTGHYVVGPKGKVKVGKEFLKPGDPIPDAFSWPASALHAGLHLQRLQFVSKQAFDITLPRKLAMCLSRSLLARALAEYGAVVASPESHGKDELVDLLMQESGFEPKPAAKPDDNSAPETVAPPTAQIVDVLAVLKPGHEEEAKRAKEKSKAGRDAKRAAQVDAEPESGHRLELSPKPVDVDAVVEKHVKTQHEALRRELATFTAEQLANEVGPMYGLELDATARPEDLIAAILAAAAPSDGPVAPTPTDLLAPGPSPEDVFGKPEGLQDVAPQDTLVSPAVVDS